MINQRKQNRFLLVLLSIFCFLQVEAQVKKTVTGTVLDAAGKPIAAATIKEKGVSNTVVSDNDGTFGITVNENAVLQISSVGYAAQDVSVAGQKNIVIRLSTSSKELGEVVVTALGVAKKDKTLGYATTTLRGNELAKTNTANPIAALQGKVAGVNINVMSSGGVQTSPNINIRGYKALGDPGKMNNQPIFVVDGTIITNNVFDADNPDAGSQLKNLNPDDYESVTVLKGAAATSLYGSRGLNGAIVITTKKGRPGTGLGIDYGFTYQTSNIYKAPMEFQNERGQGSWSAAEGNWRPDGSMIKTMGSWGPLYDGSLHPAVWNYDIKVPYVAQPDNWKAFFRNGKYINHNVALSGGGEKNTFRLSYSHTNIDGSLPNNAMIRDAFDLKINSQINKIFNNDLGVTYAHTNAKNFYSQGRYFWSSGQNLGFNTYYLPRNINTQEWYSTYRAADNTPDFTHAYGNLYAVVNAFSRFDKNNYNRYENSIMAFDQIKAQVTPWLDLSAKGNINFYKIRFEEKNFGNDKDNKGGYFGIGGKYTTDYNLLFMGHTKKDFFNGDLGADLRVFNEYWGTRYGEDWGANTDGGLRVPNQFVLSNSVNDMTSKRYFQTTFPNRLNMAVGAFLNLNYKEILNLELTGRNDWLSPLTYPHTVVGGSNRYNIFYPSVNLSYNFYDHNNAKMPKWLSSGRVRASWAYAGSDGIAEPYITGNGYSANVVVDQNGQSVPFATQVNASLQQNLDLKPQVQRSIELGSVLGFLNERLSIDFAWYRSNTFNQMVKLETPFETGYRNIIKNLGNIQNQGWELLFTANPLHKKDWNLDLALNLGHNKSKVVKFGDSNMKEWELSGGYDGANVMAYEGGEFGVLVAESWASVKHDPKTGFPLIEYVGRNKSTDPLDKRNFALYDYVGNSDADGRSRIGKVEPDLTGGINATLRYKNFTLFSQVDTRIGGWVYSEALNYAMAQGTPLASLQWRDAAHGGVKRIDSYNGLERYDGAIPDVVFNEGQMSPLQPTVSIAGMTFREAYDKGLVEPWKASAYHVYSFGWGTAINSVNNISTTKNTWVMLRDITLSYRIPTSISQKAKMRNARISFSARNIAYLYNSLGGGQNPESIQSNDPFRPYITGGVPFTRNFAISLNFGL